MKGLLVLVAIVAIGIAIGTVSATSVDVHWSGSGDIWAHAQNGNNYGDLHGHGSFIEGNFWAQDQGSYIDTDVYAYGTNARYDFNGVQELAGYTNNNAGVHAWSKGKVNTLMNLRFDQSMYIVQLERHTTSDPLLSGSGDRYNIGFDVAVFDRTMGYSSAEYYVKVRGQAGYATIDTNQWHPTVQWAYGWGNPDSINAPTPPSYYTPTNHIDAYGVGKVVEKGFGSNYVNWNGYEMPYGGSFKFVAQYGGEFHAQPDLTVR